MSGFRVSVGGKAPTFRRGSRAMVRAQAHVRRDDHRSKKAANRLARLIARYGLFPTPSSAGGVPAKAG